MSITSSESPDPRRCPRWAAVLLTVSLSANLVIAGLAIGSWLREDPARPSGGNWLEYRILSSLPEDSRAAALSVFAERAEEIDELRAMRRKLRTEAAAILEAEEYDSDALLAVFDQRQLASSALFALYYERVAVLASELTHEERVALSEGLLRRRR